METKKSDLVIIGSGPAGMMAAVYASRAGLNTLILESTGAGGQILSTSEIDNFPGFTSISGAELAVKMQSQVEACGVETIYDEIIPVQEGWRCINADGIAEFKIVCCDTTIITKTVIIATGASPRKLGLEGEEKFIGRGIHFCALCDGAFYKDKNIVVVGGGNSAVEEVLYMSPIAKNITVVNMMPDFTAFAYLTTKLKSLPNVKIFHNTKIAKISGNEKIEGVKTDSGKKIPCDGIFVAIGRKPNTAFLGDTVELSKGGYIIVDNKMQAKISNSKGDPADDPLLGGIYAAGDVCDKLVRQIVTACADGAIAATHAAEYIRSLKN